MITYYFRTIKDNELKTVTEARTGIWIHVVAPTQEEISILQTQFAIDEDILEDAQDFFEVPRVERVGAMTYFFTRYPFFDQANDADTAPLMMVVGETFVLTLSPRPVPILEQVISGKVPVVTTQKSKLFIQFMRKWGQPPFPPILSLWLWAIKELVHDCIRILKPEEGIMVGAFYRD